MPADPTPPTVDGPPCLRCGGDLADHILTVGPDNGPDEYRCLRDELQDVLYDMETSEPADDGDRVDPHWVEIVQAVAVAYERSLVSVEGPIVVDRAQHHADMERIDAGDLVGTDTVTVMATLRDIADAEPIAHENGQRCAMCGSHTYGEGRGLPFPHLVSCPWARAVQIVGVKADG